MSDTPAVNAAPTPAPASSSPPPPPDNAPTPPPARLPSQMTMSERVRRAMTRQFAQQDTPAPEAPTPPEPAQPVAATSPPVEPAPAAVPEPHALPTPPAAGAQPDLTALVQQQSQQISQLLAQLGQTAAPPAPAPTPPPVPPSPEPASFAPSQVLKDMVRAQLGEHASDWDVNNMAAEVQQAILAEQYKGHEGVDQDALNQRIAQFEAKHRQRSMQQADRDELRSLRKAVKEMQESPLKQQASTEAGRMFAGWLESSTDPSFAQTFGGLQGIAQKHGLGESLSQLAVTRAAAATDPRAPEFHAAVAREAYQLQAPIARAAEALAASGTALDAVHQALAAQSTDPAYLQILDKLAAAHRAAPPAPADVATPAETVQGNTAPPTPGVPAAAGEQVDPLDSALPKPANMKARITAIIAKHRREQQTRVR